MMTDLFEQLSDGVCLTDEKGRLSYANPAARRMIGVEDPRGRTLCSLLCEKMGQKSCGLTNGSGEKSTTVRGSLGPEVAFDWRDMRVTRKERLRDLRVRCLAQPGMHLVLIEDVSAQMELERRKEDWRHMVAHDLRSPLTSVFGTLRLLEEEPLRPAIKQLIEAGLRSGERMIDLLNLYLDIAKLESGKMPVNRSLMPLSGPVAAVRDELQAQALKKGVALDIQIADGLAVWADGSLLHRVLQNLVDNALKFSPEGGTVRITAEHDGPWVLLSVADQGPGIAREDLAKVFDRFYQAGQRREGKTQGTGLGLTFCQQAAQAMGGEIAVASTPGSGSVFTVALPSEEER